MSNVTFSDKTQAGAYNSVKFNAQDANELKNAVNSKQDTEAGKGLSTNDYTTTEKSKLSGIASGATANDTDANLKNRVNHTGVQGAATITQDSTHRFVTDTEKTTWNAKSDATDITNALNAATLYFDATTIAGDGTSGNPFSAIAGGSGVTAGVKGDITVVTPASDWQITANAVTASELAAGAVITAKILDANVTLAKLAALSGTSKLIGSNASANAPAEIILGTNLTMAGNTLNAAAGSTPVAIQDEGSAVVSASTINFVGAGVTATNVGGVATVTIPGGGASDVYTVLERLNGTGANNYIINLNQYGATYRHFRVIIHDISGQSTDINLQTTSDGVTYNTGAGDYAFTRTTGAGSTTGTDTKVWLFGLGNTGAQDAADGYLFFNNPLNNTTKNKYFTYYIQGDTYTPGFNVQFGSAKRVSTAIIHSVKILTSNAANFNFSYTLLATKIS